MKLSIAYIITGISIALLVIYGADVIIGGGAGGDGFLPFDGMTRGIGFGMPPIILSISAFAITRKNPSKGLGGMIMIVGILIMIGGAMSIGSASESENTARMAGEGGGLIAIGAFITALGAIKIKKS